jgi:hypothetical protein
LHKNVIERMGLLNGLAPVGPLVYATSTECSAPSNVKRLLKSVAWPSHRRAHALTHVSLRRAAAARDRRGKRHREPEEAVSLDRHLRLACLRKESA